MGSVAKEDAGRGRREPVEREARRLPVRHRVLAHDPAGQLVGARAWRATLGYPGDLDAEAVDIRHVCALHLATHALQSKIRDVVRTEHVGRLLLKKLRLKLRRGVWKLTLWAG